jgi:hypothetical protein
VSTDERVIDLARTVRSYLDDLLGNDPGAAARAERLDQEFASLLAAARAGQDVEDAILGRVKQPPALQTWAASFLNHGRPPDLADRGEALLAPLAGEGEALLSSSKFACPVEGDTVWYRRFVGQQVPRCRSHRVTLAPVGSR